MLKEAGLSKKGYRRKKGHRKQKVRVLKYWHNALNLVGILTYSRLCFIY